MTEVALSPKMQEISDRIKDHLSQAREGSIDHKYAVACELFETKDAEGLFEDDWTNLLHLHGMTQRSADRFMAVADRIKPEELNDLSAVRADITENKGLDWSHIEILSRLARKGDRNKAVKWWRGQDADGLSVQKLNKFVTDMIKADEPAAVRELNAKSAAAKIHKKSQEVDVLFQDVERLGLDFSTLDLTEKSQVTKNLMLDSVRSIVERGTELLKAYNAMTPRTAKSANVVAAAKAAKTQAEKVEKEESPAASAKPEQQLSQKKVTPGGGTKGKGKAKEAEPEYVDADATTPAGAPVGGAIKANRPPKGPVTQAAAPTGTATGRRRPALTDSDLS